MPAAMVAKWAREKGMSDKEAERRWSNAKLMAAKQGRNPEITKQPEDWRYVVGIFKTMMNKHRKKKAESLIHTVLQGTTPQDALDECLEELHNSLVDRTFDTQQVIDTTRVIGISHQAEKPLKTFFDGYGELRFCTEDDILINPNSDSRLQELMLYAEALDVDNPLFDLFETYEGTLDNLYKRVTDAFTLASLMR